MFFKQIRGISDNFSYIIADEVSREAAVVDPSYNAEAIIQMLTENNLNVKFVINTHQHMDHTAGNEAIMARFNAKLVAHKLAGITKGISVGDGDTLKLSDLAIKVIHTPGHSPDGICLLVEKKLLTGDTLFVGECGRTDLPSGSARDMYRSLFEKVLKLDDTVEVYPGHDYGGSHSTLGTEKKTNYTLEKRTLREFIEFMEEP